MKKFEAIYPYYKLSKGEWIILTKINDLIIKILEQSLIDYYHPKLNIALKVVHQNFDWKDEYLQVYAKEKNYKEYLKKNHYCIYQKRFDTEHLVACLTLNGIKARYSLNEEEVLENLNNFHYYTKSNLRQPLKIVESCGSVE